MENPATLGDLRDRWHPNPLEDDSAAAVARTRLDEAWRALQDELPNLLARIAAGTQPVDRVIDVVCSAALRVLLNPENFTDGSVSIDDFAETWKRDPSSVSNDLYFTRAELRRLTPSVRGAFTITPVGVRDVCR